MLDAAGASFRARQLDNVETVEADAEDLPFPDASFDVVTCRIAPHHFPSPQKFVRESARVLRPSGRFLLIDTTVPEGPAGDWQNDFEKARDASHVRSLTISEWTDLITAARLDLHTVEHFPKRHDFDDWTSRAGLDSRARDVVAARMMSAPANIQEELRVEREAGRLIALPTRRPSSSPTNPRPNTEAGCPLSNGPTRATAARGSFLQPSPDSVPEAIWKDRPSR